MTKKRSSEILADEHQKTFEHFRKSQWFFSKIGGNLKQGENAWWPQGGWTPLLLVFIIFLEIYRFLFLQYLNTSCWS